MALVYVSPGIYRDSKTGKLIKSTTGKKPTGGGNNASGNKKAPSRWGKVPASVKQDLQIQKRIADLNVGLQGTQINPFGQQTIDIDPKTGKVTTKVGLSDPQQQILAGGEQLTQTGQNLAQQGLGNYQAYGPDTAYNQAMIDSVFAQLTQGVSDQQAREKQELEQTLYNRGIPLNPSDPQYKAHMDAFNKKYQDIYGNAKLQATQQGMAYGLQGHQQNMADLASLQGMGTGFQEPNFTPYQAPQVTTSMPSELNIAMQGLKARAGGGAAAPESPFVNSLPPGYTPTA